MVQLEMKKSNSIDCMWMENNYICGLLTDAGVVELVDTPGLGPGGGNAMGVQVPPPAPGFSSYELQGLFTARRQTII